MSTYIVNSNDITLGTSNTISSSNICSSVMTNLNNSPTVTSFLTFYKLDDPSSPTDSSKLISNVSNLQNVINQQNVTQINTSNVQTYLNNLKRGGSQYDYLNTVNECLKEKANVNLDRLNKEKDALEESKDRYEFIANPEMRTSYYEGWFPINRPMKEESLFLLFASGLFLLLFSVVVFLRMGGIELNIQMPGYMESATGGFFTENKKFFGTALVLSILIIGFTYMFRDEIKKQTGYKLYE